MNYYQRPAISNSSLSMFNHQQGGSPMKFKTFILEGLKKEDDSISMENGRLIHKYIEDRDNFVIADVNKPSDMMAEWMERSHAIAYKEVLDKLWDDPALLIKTCILPEFVRKGAYKSIKDESKIIQKVIDEGWTYFQHLQETSGKQVITQSQKRLVESCIASIHANENAAELLFAQNFGEELHSELPLYWNEEFIKEVPLDFKALLDKLRINHSKKTFTIIDFKTTGKHISLYHEAFEFWRTYRQLAFYEHAVRMCMPELKDYHSEFFVVAIETQGINECRVFDIDPDWIQAGRLEYRSIIQGISLCMKNNDWRINKQTLYYSR